MNDKKVGVGKYIGQTAKTNIAYRIYRGFIGWAIGVAIFGVVAFFADVPPSVGGILLGIAAVLGLCAAGAKSNLNKSVAKYQDVKDRFSKGE